MKAYKSRTVSLLPFLLLGCSWLWQSVHTKSQTNNSYDLLNKLYSDKLHTNDYNTQIRPVLDQSKTLVVSAWFTLVTILEVDDVTQKMDTAGIITMLWKDERLTWNPFEYGGITRMTPRSKDVWKPSLLLVNGLQTLDPFNDDTSSHFNVYSDGTISWGPGNLLTTSCLLDMKKYPFDVQICPLQFCPTSFYQKDLKFEISYDQIIMNAYTQNHGWDVVNTKAKHLNAGENNQETSFSCMEFTVTLRRKSTYFIVNSLIPVMVLTLLNNFIFLVPVESGEKISYGTTVLLASAVFLSMISTQLPTTSQGMPAVTLYLLVLNMGSAVSVLVSILIVRLHHYLHKATVQAEEKTSDDDKDNAIGSNNAKKTKLHSGLNFFLRYADTVCFVLSMCNWIVSTLYFFNDTRS